MSVRAPVGDVNLVNRSICIGRGLCAIRPLINLQYTFAYVSTLKKWLETKATGSTFKAISGDIIQSILVPIPPQNEQSRIMTRIHDLESKVDEYVTFNVHLEKIDSNVVVSLRNALLQYAIQGKLIPQNPNDKPIQIQCKNPIIRRDNSYYEIIGENELCIDDLLPFNIPESWSWIRLRDISVIERGSGIKRDETVLEGMPCIRYGELYTTYKIYTTSARSFTKETIFTNSHKAHEGDLLMTLTGETKEDIGKTISYEGKESVAIGGDLAIVRHQQNPRFMSYLLNSPFVVQQKSSLSTGDQIIHIGVTKLESLLLPLPPIEEQSRIVKTIEQLLSVTNQLSY